MIHLAKVISGGQTGADQAGLVIGKRFGLKTGGYMPKGFRTLSGPRPDMAELYGVIEHPSDDYAARTEMNAYHSDGTVRLAGNFQSRGELCTLRGVKKHKKPYFDVDLTDPPPKEEFVKWLNDNQIITLNVAGNAEQSYLGAFQQSANYLAESFFLLGLQMKIYPKDIFHALGISVQGLTLDATLSGVYTGYDVNPPGNLECLVIRKR